MADNFKHRFPLRPLAATLLLSLGATAQAQSPGDAAGTLRAVTVDERTASRPADVLGFGDVPLKDAPASATLIGRDKIQAAGARRLADLVQFDASVSDAYNSPGYWDFVSIRGFILDNRYNYRREGLPINAETAIPLDNKERVEILKGTSGLQAGTSAPGGLVNYVVKRPTEQDLREVRLEATSRASLLVAADLGGRFGADRAFGYRLNLAQERLRPTTRGVDGERSLVSLATDWRLSRDTVVEAEFEWSHKSQPSQAGFSLLGNTLPVMTDPRLNLNNQPWSQPSVFDALTGTLRVEQALGADWRWSAQLGSQDLKTDDRLAYGFGCGAESDYTRYCSDGTYDLYDFRSEGERRRQQAANLTLRGKTQLGGVAHDLSFGLLASRVRNRFNGQAYNPVGTGRVDGTAVLPADPTLTGTNTNRDERSTEFSVQDAAHWTERFTTWLGLRHTRLARESVATDGSSPTAYSAQLTTPWVAATYQLTAQRTVYASWGQGVESEVVSNQPVFTNAGQALAPLKSRQLEIGLKEDHGSYRWSAAWFDIVRPAYANAGVCSADGSCTRQLDGDARHRGLELEAGLRRAAWTLDTGLMLLDAQRRNSSLTPDINGKRPTNVPHWTLRAQAAWRVPGVPGLEWQGRVSHEGRRAVTPDESIMLGGWTRVDTLLRYDTRLAGTPATWTFGIDNLFDRHYWKEAPTQYGHIYLFPGAARTIRVGIVAHL